jgi:hypothetical protein
MILEHLFTIFGWCRHQFLSHGPGAGTGTIANGAEISGAGTIFKKLVPPS